MDWTILGIAPTDDKKAITAAYRAKLRTTNPEDKPEEFKALRAAYEEALHLAEHGTKEEAVDDSPLGRWTAAVAALYDDYASRIRPESWSALLDDPICTALDTRPQAEEALLRFLMEHYYIPRTVWQALDAAFSWVERAGELGEHFPPEFIENCVVSGVRFESSLTYEQFEPGRDAAACDEYRRLYYQICQTAPEQREPLMQRLECLPEQHPYGRIIRAKELLSEDRYPEATAIFRELAERWPEDDTLTLDYAAVLVQDDKMDEAEPLIRKVLDRDPKHLNALQGFAECQAARGQLSEAKETLYDVMNHCGDDPILMDQISERLREWNLTLIGQLEEALKADPDDTKTALDLAWCHLQNERTDLALEVGETIDESKADPFDYHNFFGKLYHRIELYEDSAEHMERVVSILRNMQPDGTEKTEKRLRRLPEMLQIWGNCLLQSGQTELAGEIFREALTLAPDDPKVLTLMGNIHYSCGEYQEALEVLTHLTEVSPGSRFAYLMQAMCLYKLHNDRDAFDAVHRAMSFLGGDLSVYVLKMQILLRNGAFDQVRETLDFLKEAGAPEDLAVDFIRAQLTELADKDTESAFRQYQTISRALEEGDNLLDPGTLYYRMAMIMREKMDEDKESDRQVLLDLVEKGLKQDQYHEDCLSYKSWLLQKSGKLGEAIEMYRSLNTPGAKRALADLYFEDQDTYGAEALTAYEELLLERQTPELYFYAANCALNLGDHAKSELYSRKALELDPDDIDSLRNMALLCEYRGQTGEALDYINRSAECMWEAQRCYQWLIYHQVKVLSRLGRYDEALQVVDDAMRRGDLPGGYQMKFDICCQFGLWNQAEALLNQWAAARRGDPDQLKATGRLHLLRGKMLKATFAYGKAKRYMSAEEEEDLRIQLCELEANHKRVIELLGKRLGNGDSSHVLTNLALAVRWNGDAEGAKKIALKGLEVVDDLLSRFQSDEPLYRTRRSALLALAGRVEEARAELALARSLPLCRQCAYCKCKDADIYEAYIEEITGNRAKAMELHLAGQKNWPDELDFHAGVTRLKKNKRGT